MPFTDTEGIPGKVGLGDLPDSFGTAAGRNVGNRAGQVPDMSYFGASYATTGYMHLPSDGWGTLIQWGVWDSSPVGGINRPFTFPIPFKTACTFGIFTDRVGYQPMGTGTLTRATMDLIYGNQGGTVSTRWYAMGDA